MSRLAEFRQLEKNLADQLANLEVLRGDANLQKEMVFEDKLRSLLVRYGRNLRDVISILDPKSTANAVSLAQPKSTRKARTLKVYRNPHNGEVIETKGGNHKALKLWKNKYGSSVVESWVS